MILIISNKQDITSDYVVLEIQKRGIDYARINTEDFPVRSSGSVHISHEGIESIFCTPNKSIDFKLIKSVWYRRPVRPHIDSSIDNPGLKKFCLDESQDFLRGLWYSLDCFWISNMEAIRRAEHKVFQLQIAKNLGFTIPKTLISNQPDEVENFYHSICKNGMIIKPLFMGFIDDDDNPKTIYTSEVKLEDFVDKQSITYAPSIFQEKINKKADIRVTVIGQKIYAAEIHTKGHKSVDWRKFSIDKLVHHPHILPKKLAEKCVNLVHRLGLEFGAIDLALSEDGRYVFFEINPNGQWAWLEDVLDWPLSSELVDLLVRGK